MDTVTFQTSDGPIAITKTGAATATLTEGGSTYQLANVRVVGNTVTCDVAGEPFVTPQLIVALSPDTGGDELTITISKIWIDDGVKTYQISATDGNAISALMKQF